MRGGFSRSLQRDLGGTVAVPEGLGGAAPAEGFAGAVVEFEGDGIEVLTGVAGQAGAFGEVLAEQAVGVLVAAALPG